MITYNHEKYIGRAIESVLLQKCNFPIELVIGEDCSTDSTRKICEEYQRNNNIIKLLPSEKNLGIIPNFIRTLSSCKGKYIAVCEGDDHWIDPLKLQKQVDYLEKNENVCLVASNYIIYDEETNQSRKVSIRDRINFEILIKKKNLIPTLTTCIKSELIFSYLKEINPIDKKWPVGDYPLWLYLSLKGDIGIINDFTAVYLKRITSASHKSNIKEQYSYYNQTYNVPTFFVNKYGSSQYLKKTILKNKVKTLINYSYFTGNYKSLKKWILYSIKKTNSVPVKAIIKLSILLFNKYLRLIKFK